MIRIELESMTGTFRPGETVEGRIVWEMMSAIPQKMKSRLRWQTEGKGDDDQEVIEEIEWSPSSTSGEQKIRFELPRGPLSLDGKLIRIHWYIDAETHKPNEKISRCIVVSSQSTPITIREVKS